MYTLSRSLFIYYIGNKWIHAITEFGKYELRIDMTTFDGKKLWAKYKVFNVADEASGYKLTVGGFSGNAGKSTQLTTSKAQTGYRCVHGKMVRQLLSITALPFL